MHSADWKIGVRGTPERHSEPPRETNNGWTKNN